MADIERWPETIKTYVNKQESEIEIESESDISDTKVDICQLRQQFFTNYIETYDFEDFHECKKWECVCEHLNTISDAHNSINPTCTECNKTCKENFENKYYNEKMDKIKSYNTKVKFVKCIMLFIKNKENKFHVKLNHELTRSIIKKEWDKIKDSPTKLITYENCW